MPRGFKDVDATSDKGSMDAVSGPEKGRKIPFLDKPDVVPLSEWRARHSDTKVMLPPPRPKTVGGVRAIGPGP